MPAFGNIKAIKALDRTMTELKVETKSHNEALTKVAQEVKKLNKHNEAAAAKAELEAIKDREYDTHPIAKYQPNDMTLNQLLLRKLDIL